MKRLTRILPRTIAILLTVSLILAVGLVFYASIVMRGDRAAAIRAWEDPAVSITSTDHSIVITPTGAPSGDGLVFIPGAKVDPYAYMFKLTGLVEQAGVTVVITKPILNLAIVDQRPLETFTADAPNVATWFIGGHSLGGARACQIAGEADVAGLVLLGSYCPNDLSNSRLMVLSISGSEDGLSTSEKIQSAAALLPATTRFIEIDGHNHADFGDYGTQSGDRASTLTSDQARAASTAALVALFAAR
ncbi:MAG: alpha/beta hydrolase [Salinibacterium sp.]|nr:alpha/beta hydrolase [Salinibacterium sp.]